jgi:hypothetical protein
MATKTEQAVKARAYELWERDGRPEGRHAEHWAQAEQELGAGPSDLERDPGIGRSKGGWKEDPEPVEGENTVEGDVLNDSTPAGGVNPSRRGHTNA